jgi:hypothetical protein
VRQNFIFRPLPGYSSCRTPIEGPFMTGAATWPGGGVTGIPGHPRRPRRARTIPPVHPHRLSSQRAKVRDALEVADHVGRQAAVGDRPRASSH